MSSALMVRRRDPSRAHDCRHATHCAAMIPALVLMFLVGVNAFYVAAEYSVVGVGRVRAQRLVSERRRGARLVLSLVGEPRHLDRAITACQIGISVSSMVLGAYSQLVVAPALTPWLARVSGSSATAGLMAVVLTLLLFTGVQAVFGEQVPKSVAVRNAPRWALFTAAPLALSMALLTPAIVLLRGTAGAVLRLLRLPLLPERSLHSATEIDWMVAQSARAGAVGGDLRERLQNALRLASRRARDVMEPRVNVCAVPETISIADLRRTLQETGHTRLPVYRSSLDEIIGIVHAKDLISRDSGAAPPCLAELIRPVTLVAWSMNAITLIETMRARGAGLAVVVDERGGTAGIVTLEDVVERVLGEMKDEFGAAGPRLGKLPDGTLRLKGDEPVDEVNSRHGLDLEAREAHTIGGLVMERLTRVARPGDAVKVMGWRLEVERVHGRHIETVIVRPLAGPGGKAG